MKTSINQNNKWEFKEDQFGKILVKIKKRFETVE